MTSCTHFAKDQQKKYARAQQTRKKKETKRKNISEPTFAKLFVSTFAGTNKICNIRSIKDRDASATAADNNDGDAAHRDATIMKKKKKKKKTESKSAAIDRYRLELHYSNHCR